MSGGAFEYKQNYIREIVEVIECLIRDNNSKEKNEYGDVIGRNYPDEVIERFKEAAITLRRAAIMAQRIDWLVCDDDGVKSFTEQWDEELKNE